MAYNVEIGRNLKCCFYAWWFCFVNACVHRLTYSFPGQIQIYREGFNFKLSMIITNFTYIPFSNANFKKCTFFLGPTVTWDTLYSQWDRSKLRIWISFLQWSKCIALTLKINLYWTRSTYLMITFYLPNSSSW